MSHRGALVHIFCAGTYSVSNESGTVVLVSSRKRKGCDSGLDLIMAWKLFKTYKSWRSKIHLKSLESTIAFTRDGHNHYFKLSRSKLQLPGCVPTESCLHHIAIGFTRTGSSIILHFLNGFGPWDQSRSARRSKTCSSLCQMPQMDGYPISFWNLPGLPSASDNQPASMMRV